MGSLLNTICFIAGYLVVVELLQQWQLLTHLTLQQHLAEIYREKIMVLYIPPTVSKPNATKLMSNVAAAPAYNNYNVRNNNSYINSSLNNNWGRTDGNSQKFQQAQKKLNEVKLKGQRATSARQAEIRRVAEVKRAEAQRKEAARRQVSSSSSTYKSSSSSRSVSRSSGGRSGGG